MSAKYNTRADRDSAAEMLGRKADAAAKQAAEAEARKQADANPEGHRNGRRYDGNASDDRPTSRSTRSTGGGFGGALANVVVKELTGTTGRRIVRGILGGLFRRR